MYLFYVNVLRFLREIRDLENRRDSRKGKTRRFAPGFTARPPFPTVTPTSVGERKATPKRVPYFVSSIVPRTYVSFPFR
jgi:hypothetical protein